MAFGFKPFEWMYNSFDSTIVPGYHSTDLLNNSACVRMNPEALLSNDRDTSTISDVLARRLKER